MTSSSGVARWEKYVSFFPIPRGAEKLWSPGGPGLDLTGTHSGDQASPDQEGLWAKTSLASRGNSLSREIDSVFLKGEFARVKCCPVRSDYRGLGRLTKGRT